jgi:hypothetical protein
MNSEAQIRKAQAFRKMHDRTKVLVLPNAWDAVTARLFARLGFAAVATTSGGVAWSLGYADGEHAPLDEVVAASARIAHAIDLPVSVDLEAGYGTTPEAVADAVRAIIEAGAVGINLEDGLHVSGALRGLDAAADRIRAAREAAVAAGVPLLINARTDTYLLKYGADDSERFDETVRRARLSRGGCGLHLSHRPERWCRAPGAGEGARCADQCRGAAGDPQCSRARAPWHRTCEHGDPLYDPRFIGGGARGKGAPRKRRV